MMWFYIFNLCNNQSCVTHRMRCDKILKCAKFSHQFAIDDHRKVHIKNDVVVDSKTKHNANQHELPFVLVGRWIEPECLCLLHVCEHAYKVTFIHLIQLLPVCACQQGAIITFRKNFGKYNRPVIITKGCIDDERQFKTAKRSQGLSVAF